MVNSGLNIRIVLMSSCSRETEWKLVALNM